jgi:IMP dehydrogenase
LTTRLSGALELKIPFLSAAMMSVTGEAMALALGKEGGIGILPARLTIEEQSDIVKNLKNYEMAFVQEPIDARETATIAEVLGLIKRHGHSKVPIRDRYNTCLGVFVESEYWNSTATPDQPATSVMVPLERLLTSHDPDISVDEAKQLLEKHNKNYVVVLDNLDRLVKIAFSKDIPQLKVGVAITTYEDWEDRVHANAEAGADMFVIDTSDAHNEYVEELVKSYNALDLGPPICAGNIVTYEGAMFLMEAGADIIKVGMSSGSICSTAREKAVGRAPMAALLDVERARDDYLWKERRYVPFIADGGIATAADASVALTKADAVMMGWYFNRFFEAAGAKLNDAKELVLREDDMKLVETWGEGSDRARNLDRYGHISRKTFFSEGVEGTVPYEGRLKPYLKEDLLKIKAALVNVGCMDLPEFRENAILAPLSITAQGIVQDTHGVTVKGS